MLIALTDLLRYSVRVEDDTHSIADIFLEPSSWTAHHVALDTGTFVEPHTLLVPFRYLETPDPESRSVRLRQADTALQDAPRWSGAADDRDATPGGLAALADPLIRLLPDATRPDAGTEAGAEPEARQIASGNMRLQRLLGLPVTGPDGVLGKLDDLILDWQSGRLSHVVVDNGVTLPGRQLLVDIARFEALDPDAGRVVTKMTEMQLEQEPQIEEAGQVDRHWLDTARTYYGL